ARIARDRGGCECGTDFGVREDFSHAGRLRETRAADEGAFTWRFASSSPRGQGEGHQEERGQRAQGRRVEMNEPYDLIQTVQLTEKASLLSEKQNKYVFRVSPRANKIQIKQAIQ